MSHYNDARIVHQRMAQMLERAENGAEITDADQDEFDRLAGVFDRHVEADRNERKAALTDPGNGYRRASGEGGGVDEYGNKAHDPFADERADHRPGDPLRGLRTGAMRTLDKLVDGNQLPARSAEVVENLTRTGSGLEQTWAAKLVEALGDDNYLRAFSKLVRDPARGHLLWDKAEHEAFQRVERLRDEMRAMTTTDTQGGYMSPLVLDPTILLTSGGSINPLRRISRVVQTVSDTWNGVTSAGVTAEWLAEGAEAADASPTLAQPSVPVYKQSAFIPFSYEIGMDATAFNTEIPKLLMDGLDQLSATAFTTGSGSGQPTGIITALAGSGSQVNTATADVLASADVYVLQNALPPRFSANAQWCANLAIWNTLRQFETGAGALRFPELRDNPPRLLNRNAHEVSNMDSTIAGGAGNDHILLYGDFQQFVIVDRWPSQLELIPNLFGANRRPSGQRGMFLWARVGSDCVIDNAFRLLSA